MDEKIKYNLCTECGASGSCKDVDYKEYKIIKGKKGLVGYGAKQELKLAKKYYPNVFVRIKWVCRIFAFVILGLSIIILIK